MSAPLHVSHANRTGARRTRLRYIIVPTVAVLSALVIVPPASAATDAPALSTGRGTVSIVAGTYDYYFAGQRASVYGEIAPVAPAAGVPTGTVRVVSLEPGTPTDTPPLLPGDTTAMFYSDAQPSLPGTRQFRVDYLGDKNFAPASKTFDYFVPTGPDTKTSLAVKPAGTIAVGQSITFTANVTDSQGRALNGQRFGEEVSFFDNGQPLAGDQISGAWHSTLTTSSLSAGVHRITAESFAVFYDSSTSPPVVVTVTANPATVRGTLTVSPRGTVHLGTPVAATARFSSPAGTVTGSVQFYDLTKKVGRSVALSDGVATLTYTALKAGPHALVARYLGTTEFAPGLTLPRIVRVVS